MKIRVDQKYPRSQFNGYYHDEKMSYEVYVWIKHLEEEMKIAKNVLEMVEDHRKMPHQHKDDYTKLCACSS